MERILSDEERKTIAQAKLKLMAQGMTEDQAHSFIIHQAMRRRITKVVLAEQIIEQGGKA